MAKLDESRIRLAGAQLRATEFNLDPDLSAALAACDRHAAIVVEGNRREQKAAEQDREHASIAHDLRMERRCGEQQAACFDQRLELSCRGARALTGVAG